MRLYASLLVIFLFSEACKTRPEEAAINPALEVEHPLFPPLVYPPDNVPNAQRVALGRKLFFDPILSRDSSVACGDCHFPVHAFSDTVALSQGFHQRAGFRNAPPLQDLAWRSSYFRDGGIRSLELQVLAPLFDSAEMAFDPLDLEARLKRSTEYKEDFQQAYSREPDFYGVVRALASFERSLQSPINRFDRFLLGEEDVLNASEKRGMQLFFSARTQCSSCHSGVFFTDDAFHNIGWGSTADFGRYRITHQVEDSAKFRTPPLRSIRITAPYMHDGGLKSLTEVIEHYNQGGKADPRKDPRIRPLGLEEREKLDLLAFLEAL